VFLVVGVVFFAFGLVVIHKRISTKKKQKDQILSLKILISQFATIFKNVVEFQLYNVLYLR